MNRLYIEKKISATLSKRSLKKLLLEACTKSAFSFNKKLYEQIDGVSMGSPLGPLMTNAILTELERVVLNDLFNKGYLKFYIRFMDDKLVLMKKYDVPIVLQALNGFHENLNFTVDTFENKKVHFLDPLIDRNTTDIFYKDTHTVQYTNYNSLMPWKLKMSWVKSLYFLASKICSSKRLLKNQIKLIEQFLSWNDFPKYIRKSFMKNICKEASKQGKNIVNKENIPTIWIRLPYIGNKGEHLLKQCIRKVKRNCNTDIKFVILFNTKKICYYCTVKIKIPLTQKSSVIYQITCPGCLKRYVRKTDRCFHVRMSEHGRKPDQPMHRHLKHCSYFQELGQLYSLPCDGETVDIDIKEHLINVVLNNCRIMDQNNNRSQLRFLEAYYI